MSKKDSFWDHPYGGIFDFNGDGKESIDEQWIGFTMMEEARIAEEERRARLAEQKAIKKAIKKANRRKWWQFDEDDFAYEVVEDNNEASEQAQYAWRAHAEDGSEYGLDPNNYETEQEYKRTLHSYKYGWRKRAMREDTLGLDPKQFETQKEYDEAWLARYNEQERKQFEQRMKQHELQQKQRRDEIEERRRKQERERITDTTIYTYCGVKLPFSDRPYYFRTDDDTMTIGDTVIVPVGEEQKEMEGTIVSVGQYARLGVPFPVERSKFILRKAEADADGTGTGSASTIGS